MSLVQFTNDRYFPGKPLKQGFLYRYSVRDEKEIKSDMLAAIGPGNFYEVLTVLRYHFQVSAYRVAFPNDIKVNAEEDRLVRGIIWNNTPKMDDQIEYKIPVLADATQPFYLLDREQRFLCVLTPEQVAQCL